MSRPMTPARLLTLLTIALLAMCSATLGPHHALTRMGWITLMTALIFNLSRHRAPLGYGSLIGSTLLGLALAIACAQLDWLSTAAALVPAAFQGLLAMLVLRTLLSQRMPAIERIASALHPEQVPFPPDVRAYARRSTWLWFAVFAALSLLHLVQALGGAAARSEFAVLIVDLAVIGLVLMLEFGYRRWVLADQNASNLWQFVLALRRVDPLRLLLS